MDTTTIKCRDLMVGDWVADRYGYITQIIFVGNGYASFEDDERNPCQIDDKYNKPQPIPLTSEILEKNDWYWGFTSDEKNFKNCVMGAYEPHWVYDKSAGEISLYFQKDTDGGALRIADQRFNRRLDFFWCDTLYVHELQHALRLCGLDELANNFKI